MDENMNNNENKEIVEDIFFETNTENVSETTETKVEDAKKIVNDIIAKGKEIFEKHKKYFMIGLGAIATIVVLAILFSTIGKGKAGNSTGNLANGGFATGKSGEIYYLHLDDEDIEGVYKSKGDKTEEVIDEEMLYINKDGNYLYGLMQDEDSSYKINLVKVKTNGKKLEKIVKDVDGATPVTVVDGWIYYGKDGNFYKIKTNGKDKEKICNKSVLSYQIEGKWIYYSHRKDEDIIISRMKTNGEDNEKIIDEATKYFIVDGNKIYYLEEIHNKKTYEYTYQLCKVKTNGKNSEEICKLKDNAYTINMNKDGVFYSVMDDNAEKYIIYQLDYKGKEHTKITTTSINPQINIVGDYIMYSDYNKDDEKAMFKIKTNGEDKVELKK